MTTNIICASVFLREGGVNPYYKEAANTLQITFRSLSPALNGKKKRKFHRLEVHTEHALVLFI